MEKVIDNTRQLTPRERVVRHLLGELVDRLPFMTIWGPWPKTTRQWQAQGMENENDWFDLFGFDPYMKFIPVKLGAWPRFETKVLADEGETYVHLDEWGVTLRDRKDHDSMSQFLDYPVKDRLTWEKFKEERLNPDAPGRLPDNWTELAKEYTSRDYALVIGEYPCGFFGTPRLLMGDEEFLVMAATAPDFVLEINEHLCYLWRAIWERVFRDVQPDLVFFWEDMAGEQGSMISQAMFRRYMTPFYRLLIGLAKSHGVPIASVDTDGFAEDLAPLFEEAGIDSMWPWEVQTGNDLRRARAAHRTMAFAGGMDKRAMAKGREAMDVEIRRVGNVL